MQDVKDNNDNQPIKYTTMKLIFMQWALDFYMENPHTNCGDKKPWGLRYTNLNPLYQIKLHKFTWLLYPKDLLSNTYNLIHVCDTITFNCSSGSLQPHWEDKDL